MNKKSLIVANIAETPNISKNVVSFILNSKLRISEKLLKSKT